MSKIIGIDLGTTNSCMAVLQGGQPVVIPNSQGGNTTPSIVAKTKDGKEVVGVVAKNQMVTNPKQTFYSIKRLIGRRWDDPEVQRDVKLLPFDLRKSDKDGVEIKFGDEWLPPEAISAKVLGKLKADAEAYLGEKVTEAVITVPAYFDDSQRQATKNAGRIAGLNVQRIINEPTAAALAYGLDKKKDETIAVYDLGGGTFDITILELGDGVFEVKSTNGDTHLGGDDFDQVLIDYLAEEFNKETGINLKADPLALQRLKEAAEKAKIELSSAQSTDINLPFITADASGPKHLNKNLTRAEFENLVGGLVEKSIDAVKKALADAGMQKGDIEEVVMVGGMTRMPLVIKAVKEFFGKEPNKSVNPDEVVAIGAAVQGGVLTGDVKDITLLDVTPLTLAIETMGGVATPMIPRNTTIPTEKTQIFSTAADNQPSAEIVVVQGERPKALDNKILGRFVIDIAPAPRGVPQIEISYKIDANGILNVSAKDKATGKESGITITASTSMTESEIEKMVKDAEVNAEKDKLYKEKTELKNNALSLVFQVEKLLEDAGDKIDENKKAEIETLNKEVKEMAEKEDFNEASLKVKTDELNQKIQAATTEMYQKASQAQQNMGDQTPGSAAENPESSNAKQAEDGEVVG
ncbi:molecular chaperone DnaK [bacterium]|nr:MAG: molecular chaperone DnaK [bacterium]